MHNFKEYQGEIRKPSSAINAKKKNIRKQYNGKDYQSLQEN